MRRDAFVAAILIMVMAAICAAAIWEEVAD
jgi:hypothetical protein